MITLEEIKTAFKDYAYKYGSAHIGTKLPYIVAIGTESDNYSADNKVFSNKNGIELDCYFAKKNESAEQNIEDILDSLGVIWEKNESYDETQEFYLITYTFWR